MARYGKKSQESVRRAMEKMKKGKLKSGRSGKTVRNPKQAIAIGLSEAREKGAKVPPRTGSRSSSARSGSSSRRSSKSRSSSQSRSGKTTRSSRTTRPSSRSKSSSAGSRQETSRRRERSSGTTGSRRAAAKPRRPSPRGARGNITTDHEFIRTWVEERQGRPARVKATGGGEDPGILRIDFPGYSGETSLEEIPWEEFFEKFEENGLAFLYQEKTARGQMSRFNKLVSRDEGHRK